MDKIEYFKRKYKKALEGIVQDKEVDSVFVRGFRFKTAKKIFLINCENMIMPSIALSIGDKIYVNAVKFNSNYYDGSLIALANVTTGRIYKVDEESPVNQPLRAILPTSEIFEIPQVH